ncbi:hypothetical protein IL38_24065 [Actinopolyspora erythraea]|uniref:Uncharacterized protein n=1 Tax=Actinopolyspora erythraea TaxID=414996 RepID=A0ABR4WYB0_9ACTN|nr:hypothetical protein [Actinopolyspora erythraea]KGI79375.1 hypothetical protein IL38_24065 [Actinopolyspora erythraea]
MIVHAGRGISVAEETQQSVTTYTVSVDGTLLAGPGTRWNPDTQQFEVKLRATNPGLAIDGTGGLYNSSGEGPAPPEGSGATVAALEARLPQQNVVAGVWGAGYLIRPQSTRGAVQYAAQRGFDAIHLPTRFLRDGTPVVFPYEHLSQTEIQGQQVQVQDIQRWRILANEPGLWYPVTNPEPDDPQKGWFGYLEPNETGLMSLAEAFELVRNSAVILVDLQFPEFDQSSMTWSNPTPAERVTQFLNRVRVLIQRYGLQASTVVLTTTPRVPNGTAEGRPVLSGFVGAGIRSGAILLTQADVDRYPASSYPADWPWVVLDQSLPNDTISPYVDTGLYTLLSTVNRQYQHDRKVTPTGALGVISADPEYYAGALSTHPTAGNYAYRKDYVTWDFNTIENGVLPLEDLDVSTNNPRYRGELWRYQNGWNLGTSVHQSPNGGPYYTMHGQLCPIPYSSYTLEVFIDPTTLDPDGANGHYATLALCITTDHPYDQGSNSPPDQSGYIITYPASRELGIYSYDPASGGLVLRGGFTASGGDDGYKRFHIVVSPDDLRFRFLNRDTGEVIQQYPPEGEPAPDWALQWRGGYIALGQYANNEPPRSATFHSMSVKNTVRAAPAEGRRTSRRSRKRPPSE